jgi:hypothetical protein
MANFNALGTAVGVALLLLSASGPLQAGVSQPSRKVLTRAVTQYLSDHGDLCVGKFTWPRTVTPEDRVARTNDAVQLPVLERLGLVESQNLSAPMADASAEPAKRYSLTEKGRRYYLRKKRITVGAHDLPIEHDEDLCVAHLSLDKVVKWSPPELLHGHLATVVRYTYHIEAADWMSDAQAREVFPVVDRIIRDEGNMLMTVTVRLQDGKWQPVLPTL